MSGVDRIVARYVEASVARYGVASALARTRRLTHEPCYRHKPQWLTRAIEVLSEMDKPHAIARKWVSRLGLGFHPDTRGDDYTPPLSQAERRDYDADMESLFAIADDPYACGLKAMADAGLIP